ncbi:lactate dehydrogenase-like 2-hydroxyacid dehydrogenase [Pseudomonas sp. BIGb0408]|uniref:Lactate dehydrogenase-like 2-hydroxyacid dehydrogenase n=1 Tax=Phytopseudomonas flavescens TaxID=29435 RepID=A0A7Y9XKE1_9GAMM|nr:MULTISPECIES: 2-hydroxyacid dehydrogenase [Pseudomonas]MCW2292458.1 lactate dehydrogenase-like 2-hydroxyacid dehydrogenase [Pseudomonas sp. BIGb0408]NYH72971.1 lactate dehydrogenase-like 2-hydroxyacid dehydrogenase [Pseudomonas flavescens]
MKPEVLQLSPILIPEIRDKLDQLFTIRRYYEQADKASYLAQHGANIRGVITGGHTGITQTVMAQLPNLEVVAVNGVGTDAIDLAYARDRGIQVTATIGALTEDVADLAIGLLISACRGISTGDRYVRSGQWATSATPLVPLPLARQMSGMRIGIVGMGRVGRAVATRAAAFGCPISYTDLQAMSDVPYTFVADLLALASDSDALILAAAADKGEAIVNAEVLHALGRDGYLINIARGKLVDEPALVAALQNGQIAGAGLDVFADEPQVPGELFELEQVVLQPHRASATVQTRTRMGEMVVASLVDVFAGRKPGGSVTG